MSLDLDKSTWKRVAFGDAIASITDRVDIPSEAGVERYVGLEHLDPGAMTVQRWDRPEKVEAQKLRFQPGDVIFGRRRAYQKKVACADFEGICSAHALVLRAIPDQVHPDFLPVFLSSDYFLDRAIAISVGSLSPTVNWRDLKVQEFDLPPLDEQKRIADLLWSIEHHRSSTLEAGFSLKAVVDRVVADALVKHETSTVPLPQVVDKMTVGVVVRPAQYYTKDHSGVPALRGLNIKPGGFDLTELVFFDSRSAAELSKSTLHLGDVVIVRTGRPGDAAVVSEATNGFNCIDLIITRPGRQLLPEFFALYLNSSYGRAQISRLSAGTAQQHFNVGALKKLKVPSLSLGEQGRIIARVKTVRETGLAFSSEAVALNSLLSSIRAEVFGGN